MINRNFRDFKFQHKRNQNQVLFLSQKVKGDKEVLNLIDNFLVEKNSVMKPTERTTCLYKNILHLVPAPLVGSLQTGAGLQAWSEEAAIWRLSI